MSWPKKRRLLPAVAVIGVVAGLLWLPRPSEQPAVYLTEHRSDAAVQLARQELLETIDDMQPPQRLAMPSWLGGTSPQVSVVVGTAANPEVRQLAHKYGVALPALAPEEYIIQPLQGGSTPRVLVAGGDELGVAYGMLRLSEGPAVASRLFGDAVASAPRAGHGAAASLRSFGSHIPGPGPGATMGLQRSDDGTLAQPGLL